MSDLNPTKLIVAQRCPAWSHCLLALAIAGCSFKSLDHLQGGDAESNAGGQAAAGRTGNSTDGGASGAEGASGPLGGFAGSKTVPSDGGHDAGSGGSTNAQAGGTTVTSGGHTLVGAAGLGGGATASGGVPAGAAGSSTIGSSAGAGQSGGTKGFAGSAGAAGLAGTTALGGGTGMTYGVPAQSCAGGLTCPTGTSCCTQLEVAAGSYPMGTNADPSRSSDETPQHTATLDRFLMDKFEVTVGRFRNFVRAYDGTMPPIGAGAHPKIVNSGWQLDFDACLPTSQSSLRTAINCSTGQYQTWTESAGVREDMPMNCVSWYIAFAFCIWDKGRLATEAEWEMAATNGASDSRFPWGTTDPDPAVHAVMNCLGDGVAGCSPSDLLPVASRSAGVNQSGHLDLAGSLWEWVLDYYEATYYQSIGTCSNCSNLAGTTPRAIRGGNFVSAPASLRATGRASKTPITIDPYVGIRCVRTP